MKKILLIEDNPQLLKNKIEELRHNFTYSIDTVENFEQLQEYIKLNKENVFIALLDYFLDGAMEGQSVDLLLEHNIPTIVYTQEYSTDIREILLDKCVFEYLIKKPNSDLLYSTRLIERVYKNNFIKALIVDGSESFRNQLAENLQQFGLASLHSSDANTTLELLKNHSDIQLVLIDLDISGDIQGVELVEAIRAQFPSTSLAVLGMTPHGYNSQLSIEFLKKGANDFITKPFVKEQLNLRIMQVLEMLDTIQEKSIEATIDPLTQLKNRRALEVESKVLIQSALLTNKPLSVAMIDIDHFKVVNDTYGHDVGDDVLKLISKVLKSNFRKKDLIVRNGGEEFCVVLDDLSLEKVINLFEKLIKKIASTPYEKDDVVINITASIGLFHGINNNIKPMLSLADKKLYVAKKTGRNKLVS
ncbi:diguanylate cyclase [Colwellia ponticola]|uniref:diguanylate cyclase n=1 Tax=Colwellia ponticola TaxID=2304625 RepID=A0A8H2JL48_9GAMM|nr:diguanylate cyclase [Colwellia ponticola]TMM44836.1 diguanylate cyclase [Colwellia ponticola]